VTNPILNFRVCKNLFATGSLLKYNIPQHM
jgi:hypothetical protein